MDSELPPSSDLWKFFVEQLNEGELLVSMDLLRAMEPIDDELLLEIDASVRSNDGTFEQADRVVVAAGYLHYATF